MTTGSYEPSAWELPSQRQCNEAYRHYPGRDVKKHQLLDNCPAHSINGTVLRLSEHEKWAESRNIYITSGDDIARHIAFDLMLSYVTDTNPPVRRDIVKPVKQVPVRQVPVPILIALYLIIVGTTILAML